MTHTHTHTHRPTPIPKTSGCTVHPGAPQNQLTESYTPSVSLAPWVLFWNLLKDSLHSSHRFDKGNFCHIPTPQLVNLLTENSVGYYDVLGAFLSWWSIVPKVDLALHQIRHISRRSEIGWTSAAGRTWWRRTSSSFDFGYKHLQFTRNSFEDHNSNINIFTLYIPVLYICIHWWWMFIVTWWPNIFHNGCFLFSQVCQPIRGYRLTQCFCKRLGGINEFGDTWDSHSKVVLEYGTFTFLGTVFIWIMWA